MLQTRLADRTSRHSTPAFCSPGSRRAGSPAQPWLVRRSEVIGPSSLSISSRVGECYVWRERGDSGDLFTRGGIRAGDLGAVRSSNRLTVGRGRPCVLGSPARTAGGRLHPSSTQSPGLSAAMLATVVDAATEASVGIAGDQAATVLGFTTTRCSTSRSPGNRPGDLPAGQGIQPVGTRRRTRRQPTLSSTGRVIRDQRPWSACSRRDTVTRNRAEESALWTSRS
jgi:hypothetical protein